MTFTGDEAFRALVTASSQVLYRMNPNWTEMRQLGGGGFLADTSIPTQEWVESYIPTDERPRVLAAIRDAIAAKDVFELEHRVWRADGTIGWTYSRAVPLFDEAGEIREWFGAASDVTARKEAEHALKAALNEKEALLKEVHHRVKNNLQVITSLLEMQAHASPDAASAAQMEDACTRVASIASMHELLYRSGSFADVDLSSYAGELSRRLVQIYGVADRVDVHIHGDGVTLPLERAVPLGLLLNELVSNVCKHAFPPPRSGTLHISLRQDADAIYASVADNGVGLDDPAAVERSSTLGLKLVRALAAQLSGGVAASSDGGTRVDLLIPRWS